MIRTIMAGVLGTFALTGVASAFPYCIEYSQTGAMNGDINECWKNIRTSYSEEKTEISMMGFTQSETKNTIRKNGKIYSWDPTTLNGTVTDDPWASTEFKGDPVKNGESFLTGMGFTKTAESKTIVGETCYVWTSAQMGNNCMTKDLVLLEQSINLGPMMSVTRTATRLRRGTSGDGSRYNLPSNVNISEVNLPLAPGGGVDLGALLGGGN